MGSIILLLFLVSCEIVARSCRSAIDWTDQLVALSMWHCFLTTKTHLHIADVFAIMGVRMFRETLPSKFGSMYTASFTLFQLITLDDWFELYDEIRAAEAFGSEHDGVHPAFLYFFVFIVAENFIFVNLFTAVIVNNLEIHQQKQLGTGKPKSCAGSDDAASASGPSGHGSRTPIEVRVYRHTQ